MKKSSVVLDAIKAMREELKQSHHSKKECETITSKLSNWYLVLAKVGSIYDWKGKANFNRNDFEKAEKIFPKFQSEISRYKEYAGQKKECVQICKVLSDFVSLMQSRLDLNKQAFMRIDQDEACSFADESPGNDSDFYDYV